MDSLEAVWKALNMLGSPTVFYAWKTLRQFFPKLGATGPYPVQNAILQAPSKKNNTLYWSMFRLRRAKLFSIEKI